MPATQSDVIDPETYKQLQDLMGEEDFTEIINFFCSDTEEALENLRQAIAEQQSDYVGGICHKLKSSSKLLGAHTMAELSTELELYTDNNDTELARKLLNRLKKEFNAVHQWIKRAKNQLPASI